MINSYEQYESKLLQEQHNKGRLLSFDDKRKNITSPYWKCFKRL